MKRIPISLYEISRVKEPVRYTDLGCVYSRIYRILSQKSIHLYLNAQAERIRE